MILSTFCAATSCCHCIESARIACSSFVWLSAAGAITASPIAASAVSAEILCVYLISPPPLIGVPGWKGIETSRLLDLRLGRVERQGATRGERQLTNDAVLRSAVGLASPGICVNTIK